jgi:hypothetical protein
MRCRLTLLGDRLLRCLADSDCARGSACPPNPGVVTVRACLRDAVVRASRLSGRCQCKRLLLSSKVAEENRRSRSIQAGMPGRIFRVRWGIYQGEPPRLRKSVRITVGICQRNGGDRPPGHFEGDVPAESLGAPGGAHCVGHRDVQDPEKPVAVGHGQVVSTRHLVGCLIPVDAGVALPERSERRLQCGSIPYRDRAP